MSFKMRIHGLLEVPLTLFGCKNLSGKGFHVSRVAVKHRNVFHKSMESDQLRLSNS